MLMNPRPGQPVQIWYNAKVRDAMPYHGCDGTVIVASRGKPRNHLIEVDGEVIVVPCGNLRTIQTERKATS